jgi:D-threonate/D-erythronate kinase
LRSSRAGQAFRIGIVADDLTGAGDTGVQFAKRGWTTYVFSPPAFAGEFEAARRRREFADLSVLVINTQSRNLPAREAYRRARLAFSTVRDREVLYKKVDSSLRGNIGAEIDAAMDATGVGRALFAAAYPLYGRVTRDGVHYLGNAELSSTEATSDPKALVDDSHVCRIIARQSKRRSASIANCSLTGDVARLAELVEQGFCRGSQVLACDALTDVDLEALARVALGSENRPLLAGSAGFAAQLAGLMPASMDSGVQATTARRQRGAVLVVSGSASAKNEAQLRHLAQRAGTCLIALTPDQLCRSQRHQRQERKAILQSLGPQLEQGGVVVLAIRQDASRQNQPSAEISAAFGGLQTELLRRHRRHVKGLVLTGGETAELLLRNLGARGLWLLDEVEPGVPIGLVDGGCLEGLPVITKAGSLGRENTLTLCAQHLAEGYGGGHHA